MRNIRWQKMALRAANGLLDGVTALLVLLDSVIAKTSYHFLSRCAAQPKQEG